MGSFRGDLKRFAKIQFAIKSQISVWFLIIIQASFPHGKNIWGEVKRNLTENSLKSWAMKAQPLSSEIVPLGYYVIWTNTPLLFQLSAVPDTQSYCISSSCAAVILSKYLRMYRLELRSSLKVSISIFPPPRLASDVCADYTSITVSELKEKTHKWLVWPSCVTMNKWISSCFSVHDNIPK